MTSARSVAVHSRPTTSLQLRRNHLSLLAASVKRVGVMAGARAEMTLPVVACLPAFRGSPVWQLEQLQSEPWVAANHAAPRAASATNAGSA